MFTRILTEVERKRIRTYLRQGGEKGVSVRIIVSRAKKFMPAIRSDLELLERLLAAYEKKTSAKKRLHISHL